ncbi:radical SAM protein, partial [Oleiphilus sp. HI0043]|uniref:radical SAM protein n=6 Tax=Oleiphilus TaxID=141450 RepID=UPI000B2CC4CC
MNYLPINYIEPVFRPPSEAKSLILQVTNGCSYNKCTFCDMYTAEQKKFKPKKIEEIEQEVSAVAKSMPNVGRFFLADGDAMTLSFRRLKEILECINRYFPDKERVTAYCLPRNIKKKTVEE